MSDKQHRKYYAGKYGIIVEIQHPKSSSMRYATQSEIETMPIKERKGIEKERLDKGYADSTHVGKGK